MLNQNFWHFPLKPIHRKVNVVESYIRLQVNTEFAKLKHCSYQIKSKSDITLFTFNKDGRKSLYWTKDFKLHSFEDYPAVYEYWSGHKLYDYYWFREGKRHRSCGPAQITIGSVRKSSSFFINNVFYTPEYIAWAEENGIDAFNMTEEDKIFARMKWE